MYCSVLQCVVVCCSVLQCVAVSDKYCTVNSHTHCRHLKHDYFIANCLTLKANCHTRLNANNEANYCTLIAYCHTADI